MTSAARNGFVDSIVMVRIPVFCFGTTISPDKRSLASTPVGFHVTLHSGLILPGFTLTKRNSPYWLRNFWPKANDSFKPFTVKFSCVGKKRFSVKGLDESAMEKASILKGAVL